MSSCGCGCQTAMSLEEVDMALQDIPHRIILYQNLINYTPKQLINNLNNIIFFGYPGEEGHWTCLLMYPDQHLLTFFDPYGLQPDDEWRYLYNPNHLIIKHKWLSKVIIPYFQHNGWTLDVNHHDIQGYFDTTAPTECSKQMAENLCGELVVLRVRYRDVDNDEFAHIIEQYTPRQIVHLIRTYINGNQ